MRNLRAVIVLMGALGAGVMGCGSTPPATSNCAAPKLSCGAACIDPMTDATNCGACGKSCPTGQLCMAGACACMTPNTMCGGNCIDTSKDDQNCGACSMACPAGLNCVMGACACPPKNPNKCGTDCTNFLSDNMNCGACGTVCPAGQVCGMMGCGTTCPMIKPNLCGTGANEFCADFMTDNANCGACGTMCPSGLSCTGGACTCPSTSPNVCGTGAQTFCTNQMTDNNNCGACGTVCPTGQTCTSGKCACTGMTPNACGTGMTAFCTNFQMDNANCGACGTVCPTGQICSMTGCVLTCSSLTPDMCTMNNMPFCTNKMTDSLNCGACGTMCPSGQTCAGGACACPSGTPNACGTGSSAICTSFQSDAKNCGACGKACAAGQGCNAGSCMCPSGTPDSCTTAGVTICTNKQTDNSNCGACGTVCPGGQSCTAGKCTCPANTPNACGAGKTGFCTNEMTDGQNCGACAAVCSSVQTCASGKCTCPGTLPNQCGSGASATCVNFMTDGANCGACGTKCPAGQVCNAGMCSVSCAGGTVSCPTAAGLLAHSLVGWWPLEGNLNDASGHGYTGTAAGTTYSAGYVGQAMNSGSFSTPNIPLAARSFTVEAWINGSDFNADRQVIGQCDSQTMDNCLHFNIRNSKVYMGFFNDDVAGNTTLKTGTWYHVAGTYDHVSHVQTLYVNGTADGNHTSGDLGAKVSKTFIGGGGGVGVAFAGMIDEPKIFYYARSAAEITADAVKPSTCSTIAASDASNCGACNEVCPIGAGCSSGTCKCSGSQVVCGPTAAARCFDTSADPRACGACGVGCTPGTQVCNAGACQATDASTLLGWWQFEGNGNDSSLANHPVTFSGAATYVAQAWAGQGYQQAGAVTATVPTPNLSASWTVESWINAPALAAGTDYWVWGTCTSATLDNCLHLIVRNQRLYMGFYNDDLGGSAVLAPNTWYHVAWVYDSTTRTRTMYLNGVQDNQGMAGANFKGSAAVSSYINTYPPYGFGGGAIGKVDEVKVYNYPRTAAQVLEDASLLAYFPMETGVNDVGPNRNNGATHGGAAVGAAGSGAYGKGLVLDGGTGYAGGPLFWLSQNIPYTAELWFNASGPGDILDEMSNAASPNTGFHDSWLTIDAKGNLFGSVWGCNNPGLSLGTVAFGSWNHVALTYDKQALRAYLNGAAVGAANYACARSTPAASGVVANYMVGPFESTDPGAGGSANWFPGTVDEVRFYSRALSANEIAAEATR